jgi:hypothetical protein
MHVQEAPYYQQHAQVAPGSWEHWQTYVKGFALVAKKDQGKLNVRTRKSFGNADKVTRENDGCLVKTMLKWTGGDLNPHHSGDVTAARANFRKKTILDNVERMVKCNKCFCAR